MASKHISVASLNGCGTEDKSSHILARRCAIRGMKDVPIRLMVLVIPARAISPF